MNDTVYHELLRPQIHFTAEKNWLNDPNGLVYFEGEYHLFFQYNAKGLKWGPNSWGHAVSPDLMHWEQLADAIEPDSKFGWIWSGSAVVDWKNTSGLGTGPQAPLVAMYTTGDTHSKPGIPVQQCIAFSNDKGKTWTKYEGNPVVKHIAGENRDPKVVWHEPSCSWIMALYLDKTDRSLFGLFSSPDLIHWTHLQDLEMPGTTECPDFFELPVAGQPDVKKWVFWGGDGVYRIGSFDGKEFTPESEVLWSERGPHGYAAQTWSDIPASDGRRIQISWMRGGKYPYMPFNQQMCFPVELTLRSSSRGIRLHRKPVKEIELLHDKNFRWENLTVKTGSNFVPNVPGSVFHIHVVIEPGAAEAVGMYLHGTHLRYEPSKGLLTYLGKEIPVQMSDGKLELELIVDRTSLEIFAEDGEESASFCFLPEAADAPIEFYSAGSEAKIVSMDIYTLKSIWPAISAR